MQKHSSITREISRLLVGVSLIITVAYSLLILLYSWVIEDNIFNRQVIDEANFIEQTYQSTGEILSPRAAYMELYSDWQGLPKELQIQYRDNPDKVEFELTNGSTLHLQVIELGGKQYVVAANVAGFEVSRDYLPMTLIWLSGGCLLICIIVALIAVYRARIITKPLNRLAHQVERNQAIDEIRIDQDYPDNEIGLLAERIRDTIERLITAWSRELDFTKDVSHEIRTPLAITRNILSKPQAQVTQQEWQLMAEANFRLEQVTETLLALARNESTHTEKFNITELLEQCLLTNYDVNSTEKGHRINFDITCTGDIYKLANQNLAAILINNVLSNIVHYTATDKVFINLSSTAIEFTNAYQQSLPEKPLQSGEKSENSRGIGQGLSLIRRICDVYDWDIIIEDGNDTFKLKVEW